MAYIYNYSTCIWIDFLSELNVITISANKHKLRNRTPVLIHVVTFSGIDNLLILFISFQLIDYLRDLPTLLRHAFTEFFTVGGLIWMFRLRILVCFIAAFVYFISPLDIIPEAVFGVLGFLDDAFILLLLAIYVTIVYRQYVRSRLPGRQNNAPS